VDQLFDDARDFADDAGTNSSSEDFLRTLAQ
jgi:hypothetical protein